MLRCYLLILFFSQTDEVISDGLRELLYLNANVIAWYNFVVDLERLIAGKLMEIIPLHVQFCFPLICFWDFHFG